MPLRKGKSDRVRSENIKEVIHSYEKKGKIGASKPKSKKAAIKQAVAIGYSQQRRVKKMKGGGLV